MDWSRDALYNKSKLYAQRAHDEPVDSALFGFWMSLSLELAARAGLAHIHPVLLADPREPDNIHYAFGIIPKGIPKSIQAKTLFARCSVLIPGFTDKMSGLCLILADRRNSELHTGAPAFESVENSKWLPSTYEILEVLLTHLGRDFADFLGAEHGGVAIEVLKGRRETIKTEVQQKLGDARKSYAAASEEWRAQRAALTTPTTETWLRGSRLRKACKCPACANDAVMSGETVGRSPVRIDEENVSITREARVMPNMLACPFCGLYLSGFQEMHEAGLGAIYKVEEEEDPIEFFGIVPEEHVDVEELVRGYYADAEYDNE